MVRATSPSARRLGLLVLAVVMLALRPGTARAQAGAAATGYLEHQFSASLVDGAIGYLDYDRFRLDLKARAGRGAQVSAGVVWQLYRGDTHVYVRDFVPKRLDALVDSTAIELEDRHYLNHAFVVLRPGDIELTLGKQYLSWGAAWVFNPTELFRPKNMLEPTYEREGVGALTARLPLGVLSDVQVGFVPDGSFATSGKLIRVRHHIAGYDVSTLAAVVHEPDVAAGVARAVMRPDRAVNEARRITLGGDATGELIGIGIWGEATWSDHAGRQWVEATLGGNYTLANGTLLMLEGFYNGRGRWHDPYPAERWLGRLTGDVRFLGKGYVYGHASRLVGDLWTLGFSALANLGDTSGVLIPSAAYAFAQDVDILFNGLVYLGGEESEFGVDRFGCFVRARVHF